MSTPSGIYELDSASTGIRILPVCVTPETARSWLDETERGQRPISTLNVERFARDMAAGDWCLNGEMVRFDEGGSMIDGQHRLKACVASGASFETFVAVGVPNSVRRTIDKGRKRTLGHSWAEDGRKNAARLAAAVSWLWRLESGDATVFWNRRTPTEAEAENVYSRHAGLPDTLAWVTRASAFNFGGVGPSFAAAKMLCDRVDDGISDGFFARLLTGEHNGNGDPAFALQKRLLNLPHGPRGGASAIPIKVALLVKAFNFSLAGKSVTLIRMDGTRTLPAPGR